MATSFVQLPLVRLVDLAISTTEGNVNFHLLQALLHALIQKSQAQTVAVEIHGVEASKLQEQLKVAPEKPTYTIKETIDKSAQGKGQEVYVMQAETAYQGSSSVAKEKMDTLEAEINDLKNQIVELRDLPGNLGIIDAVKNFDEKSSTVIDVFHMLALQKRIEAAEEGMVKIASIVEDLIKSPDALALATKNVICQKEDKDGEDVSERRSTPSMHKKRSDSDSEQDLTLRKLQRMIEEIQQRLKMKPHRSNETLSAGADDAEEERPEVDYGDGYGDVRVKELAEQVERIDVGLNEEITRLHHQFTDIEKDFNELLNKIEAGQSGAGDGTEPNSCCSAVYQKLLQMEADFADINENNCKLLNDREEKTRLLEFLVEQLEVLKSVKADREELEEALADKADACAVLRKVSHDQFDTACEELSKGIGEALEKLTQQEFLWQQALDDIQSEIGNKLDKMDLGPLREFINNKLHLLQDKMKNLAALKREQEAAGTKNKLLRDVTCISCDKDVVMQKEYDLSMRPVAATVPPTRSMAPYLAYELDALRKQQKAVPGGKNLRSFEAAMHGRGQKKTEEDHICNRYCGGSHTITTPHQRITRLGHFLMQWGPEAQPILSGDKRSSAQPVDSDKTLELTPSTGKVISKVEQAKRISKVSTGRKSARSVSDDEPKKLSFESKKKLLASGSTIEKKISAISNESGLRIRDPTRLSKMRQDRASTDEAEQSEGQGKPPPPAPPAEGSASEVAPKSSASKEETAEPEGVVEHEETTAEAEDAA